MIELGAGGHRAHETLMSKGRSYPSHPARAASSVKMGRKRCFLGCMSAGRPIVDMPWKHSRRQGAHRCDLPRSMPAPVATSVALAVAGRSTRFAVGAEPSGESQGAGAPPRTQSGAGSAGMTDPRRSAVTDSLVRERGTLAATCYGVGRYDEVTRHHPLRRHPGRDAGIQAMDGKPAAASNLLRFGFKPSLL